MADCEDLLTPRIKNAIDRIVKREKLISHTLSARILPPDGGSFIGILRKVSIKGETEHGPKEMNLFIKTIIPGEQLSIYSVPDAYEKEAYAYKELFRVFKEVQDEAKVPITERLNTPKGYEESDSDSIIMEDLSTRGFITCDRMESASLEFAELAIKTLAKFHGISLVIQKNRPAYFNEKVKTLQQPFCYGDNKWNEFVANVSNLGISCLDPHIKEKVRKYLPTTFDKYAKYTTDPSSVRCLVHGDYRLNNIMARFDDGKLAEVLPIDYQLLFYGCPIIDFIYFIFGGTDQDFRRKYLDHLKDVYHSSMGEYLKYFDMDVEEYYPRKEFEKLFKEKLDYGLMFTLWFIPVTLADAGAVPDVTKVSLAELTFDLNDVVKSRVRGVVDDFVNWGYL